MPAFRPMLLLLALALSVLVLVTDAFTPFSPAAATRRRPTNIARYTTSEDSSSRSTTETPTPTQTPSSPPPPPPPTSSSSSGPCKKFPKCDGAMRNRGCNGDGRVMGGIATVPLLGWWPIKAYRPCPSAVDAGYGYKRKGQDFSEFIAGERRKKTGDEEDELKEF